MKIKTGVKIVIAASLFIASIAMGASFLTGRHVREIAREARSFNTIIEDINGLRGLTYDYLLYPTDRAGNQWLLVHDDIGRLLTTFKIQTPKELGVFEDLIERHDRTHNIFERLIKVNENRATEPEKDPVLKEAKNRLTGQLLIETQGMVSDASRLSSLLSDRSHSALRQADIINGCSFAVVLLFIVMNSLYIFRSVVKPVLKLHGSIGIVASGNLDHKVGIEIPNEVGDLSRTFDHMTDQLKTTMVSRDELETRVRERTAELSQTVARLELLNAELQEFAFIASHDLQEPLRKIQTFCDMAQKRSSSALDSTGREYLDRVLNSANRMRQLLRDLLAFSRVASRPEPFKELNLAKSAREAADVFEASIKETGCRLEIEDLPVIEADESQISQLFQNLIGNALKYRGSDSPSIRIYGNIEGHVCEIRVEDNGIGFEQQFAERIFKPFQRLHGRSEYEGTGMGLAICRKIAERHGGTIRAQSEPGKGAKFIVRLPVNQVKLESGIAG
jgi:signal transduction histidine kinase